MKGPQIKFKDPRIAIFNMEGSQSVEFFLPEQGASLVWHPWPEGVAIPERNPGHYVPIKIHGKDMFMPRRTRCYGHAYAFSGQTHPLETTTPQVILDLYKACEKMFNYPPGTLNMCLENDYANGRECIGAHSDDERQFGSMRDVICAVTGPASRIMVIRNKKSKERMLEVWMPSGIYAMRGKAFQELYTHEFPQLHMTFFKNLCSEAALQWGVSAADSSKRPRLEFPSEAHELEKARWIQEHAADVKDTLNSADRIKFDQWNQWRTSYTFRNFV